MNYRGRRRQHPGEILSEEWLKPLGFRAAEFAMIWGIDQDALSDIVAGKKPFDSRISRQLHDALGTPKDYWLDKQREFDGYSKVREFETIQ